MAKIYENLITENVNYCGHNGTIIISNLTCTYDLCVVESGTNNLLFGDEQGNYCGGISVTPDIWYGNQEFGHNYLGCIKKILVGYFKHNFEFYNNIKKVAYFFHKELFDFVEEYSSKKLNAL